MTTDMELARKSSNATFSALFFREEGRAVKTAFMVRQLIKFIFTENYSVQTVKFLGDTKPCKYV